MNTFIFCVFAALASVAYSQELPQQTEGGTAGCKKVECSTICRSEGYFRSMCLEHMCLCSPAYRSEENGGNLPDDPFLNYADALNPRAMCVDLVCNRSCKTKGSRSGSCHFGKCRCFRT